MNHPLKFSPTQKLLFTSDFHRGHVPVSWIDKALFKMRGFKDIAEHDKWLRDEWYKRVDEETTVFNLGDAQFSDPTGEKFREMSYWPGKHIILNGNHLSGHKQVYKKEVATQYPNLPPDVLVYPVRSGNVIFAGDILDAFIGRTAVRMMHHAPYIWPEISDGSFALCGHSHGNSQRLNIPSTDAKILDVGVDNALKHNGSPFFTWDDIVRIMNKKEVSKVDHH